MLIGGFDNTNYETSANTHIYDFESSSWSNGPTLIQARKLLGCGAFKSAAHGGKFHRFFKKDIHYNKFAGNLTPKLLEFCDFLVQRIQKKTRLRFVSDNLYF